MACEGRPLVAGSARGTLLVLDEPLSLWGGLDPETGTIIDAHHPQVGTAVTGRILAMPSGRGSSSSSSVLAEAIRLGTAPAGIVMEEADVIPVLGALVAAELYGVVCPIVELTPDDFTALRNGSTVELLPDGRVRQLGPAPDEGSMGHTKGL